jgi:hypothetical protein
MTLFKKSVVCIAAGALAGCASAATTNTASSGVAENTGRPALVVLVVVDQLRADLLDRYGDLFTGGFKRLRTEGHSYVNASHAHGVTVTAAGHATLSTGSFPNRHGVIANGWYEQSGGKWVPVENIDDTTVKIIGFPSAKGASPVHLMRSGLAEWVTASNPASIVASVSGKDRGAIQPAAHAKKGYGYWFEGVFGRFVTSTYYRIAPTASGMSQFRKQCGAGPTATARTGKLMESTSRFLTALHRPKARRSTTGCGSRIRPPLTR